MKKTLSYVIVFVMVGLVAASCSSLKKMKKQAGDITYVVTPEVLSERGGLVDLKIDITFPESYFNKKVILEATPVLRYGNGEKAFAMKAFQGEKVVGNNEEIPLLGKTATYISRIPYEDAMRLSELDIDIVGFKGLSSLAFTPRQIGSGVIATSTLVENVPMFVIGEDKFQRIIKQQEEAAIYYLVNSAQIRNKEMTSEEIKKLEAYIKEAAAKENINLNSIDVRSYASPEGPLSWNEQLAGNREKGSTTFLKNQMKKGNVAEYSGSDFIKQYVVAEDWEGFQKAMEASNIQDKELILRVLSMHSDPEVREREIKNMASAFTVIADQVLPKLRRSLFVVNTELVGKSDNEIRTLAKSRPVELSVEELLYAATLFNDNNDKLAVYQSAVKQYPQDWRSHNNLAMVQFEMGKIENAKKTLSAANIASSDKQVLANNQAVFALLSGQLDAAKVQLGNATGAGAEVEYNKGILATLEGDYATAVNYYKNTNGVNAALSNILAGNYNVAVQKLNAGENTAMASYLKAVIGARTNDTSMVMDNLKKAVEMDRSLKQVAATDMEFARYFENNAFVTIVK